MNSCNFSNSFTMHTLRWKSIILASSSFTRPFRKHRPTYFFARQLIKQEINLYASFLIIHSIKQLIPNAITSSCSLQPTSNECKPFLKRPLNKQSNKMRFTTCNSKLQCNFKTYLWLTWVPYARLFHHFALL